MGFLGMNVGAATGAKLQVAETSGVIAEMTSNLVKFITDMQADTTRQWTGDDAARFFSEEFSQLAPITQRATDKLAPQVAALARRIQRQEEASA